MEPKLTPLSIHTHLRNTRDHFVNHLCTIHTNVLITGLSREKEGDLTQSYDKTPYTNRKFENQRTTHTNATKNFDYTTIADRLRTDLSI